MIAIERQRVGGVEAGEGGEVVELFVGAGEDGLVAPGMEVAGVAGVVEHGVQCCAARGGKRNHGGEGVGAVECGVGAAVEFGGIAGAGGAGRGGEAGGGDGAEVKEAADVLGGDAVDEDFVRVGVAAAHEERGLAAGLARLDNEVAGRLTEVFDDADAGEEVVAGDERNGRGELR